jgi:hypothetical protein
VGQRLPAAPPRQGTGILICPARVIRKSAHGWRVTPHLQDWTAARASFSWQQLRDELLGRDAVGHGQPRSRSPRQR